MLLKVFFSVSVLEIVFKNLFFSPQTNHRVVKSRKHNIFCIELQVISVKNMIAYVNVKITPVDV